MAVRRAAYKAGDEIDAKCSKCKMVLGHVIVAMAAEKIARVKCLTCNGEHIYRPPPSASEATAKKRKAERKTVTLDIIPTSSTAEQYASLTKNKDLSDPKPYKPSMPLERYNVIKHPKFGVGVVTDIRQGTKAHVAFPDGGRVLICNR